MGLFKNRKFGMTWTFLIITLFMIWFEYKVDERLINVVSVITIPYIIVITINNFFAVKYGFFQISNKTILMELLGLFSIFIGTIIINHRKTILIGKYEKEYSTNEKFQFYKMDAMRNYCIIIEILCYLRLIYFVRRHGFSYLSRDGVENFLSGPIGHAYYTIYILLPILLYYWLKNKTQISFLIVALAGGALSFFSFTKYHIIGLLILCYLFISLEDYHYIKKGAVVVAGFIILAFVSNYIIGFINSRVIHSVNRNFYVNHLWKYIGGSVINSNIVFQRGLNEQADFIDKLLKCIVPLPNMFLMAIFGTEITFSNIHLGYEYVGKTYLGETSNAIDFIGYMFPSKGDVFDVIIFSVIMCMFGMLSAYLYNKSVKNKNSFYITICVYFTFFLALAFFGEFATKSMTWELLVWSAILPKLFDRRIKIKISR